METVVCTKCKRELPQTNEYFSKDKHASNGLKCWCKACVKEYREIHRAEIIEKNKRYYEDNKEARLLKGKIYREENKDKIKEKNKRYAENNRDKCREYAKQYYNNNNEQVKARRNQYFSTEHGKIVRAVTWQMRQARKHSTQAQFSVAEWAQCKQHFGNVCAYCGSDNTLHQDHFVPLSKGGEYTKNNIIPACKSCNSSKHNKDFFKWYKKQPHYSKEREEKILQYLNYNITTKQQQLSISLRGAFVL